MAQSTHSKYFNGPLYTRMAEDLHLGGMSERTHAGYLRAVRKLADYCKTSPDKITEDQLRRFFLHMKNELNYAYGTLRVAFSGIKFFYTRTCKRDWQTLQQMKLQNVKSLPEVITRNQVLQIVECRQHAADGRLLLDRLLARPANAGRTQSASRRHRCRAGHGPRASRQRGQGSLRAAAHLDAADC